jgi:hypothetical protein
VHSSWLSCTKDMVALSKKQWGKHTLFIYMQTLLNTGNQIAHVVHALNFPQTVCF